MTRRKNVILFSALLAIMVGSLVLIALPQPVAAQEGPLPVDECSFSCTGDSDDYVRLNIVIPGVAPMTSCGFPAVKNMQCFIRGMYIYFAWVAGILATLMIMFGGFKYVVSFGSPTKIADAKDTILSAMIGLALLLASYTILFFINPNIVNLKDLNVQSIGKIKADLWCEVMCDEDDPEDALCIIPDPQDSNNRPKPIGLGETWDEKELACGVPGLMVYTDGREQDCMFRGDYASPGCPSGSICAPDYLSGEGYTCEVPQRYCRLAFAGTCEQVDKIFQTQNLDNALCEEGRDNSGCVFRTQPPLSCEDEQGADNYYQVYCDTGNGLTRGGNQETDCWDRDDNKPKSKCVDRRTGGFDWAICCLELNSGTSGIQCRGPEQGFCNSDEIKLASCTLPEYLETPGGLKEQKKLDAWLQEIRDPVSGRVITPGACTDGQLLAGWECCMEMEDEDTSRPDVEGQGQQ